MKAIKINLKAYTVEGFDGKKMIQVPYDVKKSIENILLATGQATNQKLPMSALLRNAKLAQKILDAKDSVLLDENEFRLVKASFDAFQAFGKNEVELCKRIDEAKTVEVKEKKEKKK